MLLQLIGGENGVNIPTTMTHISVMILKEVIKLVIYLRAK